MVVFARNGTDMVGKVNITPKIRGFYRDNFFVVAIIMHARTMEQFGNL